MKKKISRILGVGLTVMLLTGLMVAASPAAPASAGTLEFGPFSEFPPFPPPPVPTLEFIDLAVNGNVIYAASGAQVVMVGMPPAPKVFPLVKSVDGGGSWTDLSRTTGFPDYDGVATTDDPLPVYQVAVAPDDPNFVAICAVDDSGATDEYYIYWSEDGGSEWFDANLDAANPPAGTVINDVAVSGMTGGYYNIAAAGTDGTDAELYCRELSMRGSFERMSGYGAAAPPAQPLTGFDPTDWDAIQAVAISPNFQIDRVIGMIAYDASDNASFHCFHFEEDLMGWNQQIDGFDDWGLGVSLGDLDGNPLDSASIAFISSYDGTDEGERIVFVGLSPETSDIAQKYAGETHGAYRLTDINPTTITNWAGGGLGPIYSVAYHEAGKLLLGAYEHNRVYVCLSPMDRDPACERYIDEKQPGGEDKTFVAWSGDNAVASTQGDESAFATSADDGYTFNDISNVDTSHSVIVDFAMSPDGAMNYVTTYDTSEGTGNYDTSVWNKVGFAWHRVLSMRDVADANAPLQIRIAPDDPKLIFLYTQGTRSIWVNKDSGKAKWNKRTCKVNVQDFVAESSDVLYAISTSSITKSTNGGSSWSTAKGFEGKTAYMITLASNNDILIGTTTGHIIYSKDGGSTFTAAAVGGASFGLTVEPDTNYADNGIIYWTSPSPSPFGPASINRGVLGPMIIPKGIGIELPIGYELEWTRTGTPPVVGTGGPEFNSTEQITDIAMAGDVLYALVNQCDMTTTPPTIIRSYLFRALHPRDADDKQKAEWSYVRPALVMDVAPRIFGSAEYLPEPLKIAPGYVDFMSGAAMVKVAMIDSGAFGPTVESFGDPLTTGGITLTAPASEQVVPVNPITGRAYDMTFSWDRFSNKEIVRCDIQIATDPDFIARLMWVEVSGITRDQIARVIGPNGSGVLRTEFMPNTTYYWRVRVTGIDPDEYWPWLSPWSQTYTFSVEGELAFEIISPEIGATGVSITPSLSWTEYPGAIGYEVAVAEDPTFAILDVSHSADYTFYKVEEPLKYSTTYYWRVRAVTGEAAPKMPAPGSEWIEAVFTTEAEPVEPEPTVIVQEKPAPPPQVIIEQVEVPGPPASIPNYLLWTIVGIGAVLLIALIVLIVRTRRVV